MERFTLGRMQNPVRGLLHGSAAVAAAAGTTYLAARSGGSLSALVASTIFGLTLVFMYSVSAIYHSVRWSPRWKRRLQRIDHSMIYLTVAATFTPIAIASLPAPALWWSLGVVWGVAVVGISLKLAMPAVRTGLSVLLQLVMGWTALIWMPRFGETLGTPALVLILTGGALYTLGVALFITKRPRLAPPVFSYHEVFHVLVVLASLTHYLAVARYVVPALA